MQGYEIARNLNEYYFNEEYYKTGNSFFTYVSDGDEGAIYYGDVALLLWDECDWEDCYEEDDREDTCKKEFNKRISQMFQRSADAQVREMEDIANSGDAANMEET